MLERCPNCKDIIRAILPEACQRHCNMSRKELLLEKGRQKLLAETNIIDTIYQLRYLKDAVKVLLPKDRRKELK